MFAVPQGKIQAMTAGLKQGGMFSYRENYMAMLQDFEQPAFYKELFKSWGMNVK